MEQTNIVMGECFEIWAMLKAQIPFLMTCCFDPEPTIFFNNFGNHQNRIWKKPCKFEQEMLSHKGSPGPTKRVGHWCSVRRNAAMRSQLPRAERGDLFWPALGGIREPVVGGRSRCEELFWEGRRGGEGPVPVVWSPSLVCLFPASTTNLYYNCTRRLLSVTV